jgi:Saccharopine dehydrogenase NADP binding domain
MTDDGRVGILGGYGGVGRVAAVRLHSWGVRRQRIGGRHPERALPLIAKTAGGEAEAVDADDPGSLARFCEGCAVVVNCAGPSSHLLDRVARAALAAGADYVDAGGDDAVYDRLADRDLARGGRTVQLSAGMVPGLSGLLPRHLAATFDRVTRLTAYVGGRGRMTATAAADYLAASGGGSGASLASWTRGARVPLSLTPLRGVELPFFGSGLTAYPYLSKETERLASDLGISEVRWYTVFDGENLPRSLARHRGMSGGQAVADLVRAASLDAFGRHPYQVMVFQLDGESGGRPRSRTLVVRGCDANELTGTTTALAALATLREEVPPGLHFAAQALDPGTTLRRLRETAHDLVVHVIDEHAGPSPAAMEDGIL